jgi:hypothetical protein
MSKTTITAEPGIPQIVVTREFDAPSSPCTRRATYQPFAGRSRTLWRGGAAKLAGRTRMCFSSGREKLGVVPDRLE